MAQRLKTIRLYFSLWLLLSVFYLKDIHMYKNAYTTPLMMDIYMAVAIFIFALLAMVGTILRIIASCINFMARLVYSVSDCGTRVYVKITRHRPKSIEYTVN